MKKLIIIGSLVLFLSQNSFSQMGCDCSDPLDKDFKTLYSSYKREDFRTFLYNYFNSSIKERKKMKKNNSLGLSSIIESLPIDFNQERELEKSFWKSIYQEVLRTYEVSNQSINTIIESSMPDRAFESYDKCLDICVDYVKLINKNGLRVIAIVESQDIVTLSIEWNSSPADQPITISSADYTNGTALHGKKLSKGKRINDGQIIIETIKRRPNKDLTIVVNFEGGSIGSVKKTLPAVNNSLNYGLPVGTIISSVLDWDSYHMLLEKKGSSHWVADKSKWAPADGRSVAGSYYAKKTKKLKVPDLRGIFLRGLNSFDPFYNTKPISPNQIIAENNNLSVGEFQDDAIINIKGSFIGSNINQTGKNAFTGIDHPNGLINNWNHSKYDHRGKEFIFDSSKAKGVKVAKENRPKNVSLYYYIKIN